MGDSDCCCIALIMQSYSLFTQHVALPVSAMCTAHIQEKNLKSLAK